MDKFNTKCSTCNREEGAYITIDHCCSSQDNFAFEVLYANYQFYIIIVVNVTLNNFNNLYRARHDECRI